MRFLVRFIISTAGIIRVVRNRLMIWYDMESPCRVHTCSFIWWNREEPLCARVTRVAWVEKEERFYWLMLIPDKQQAWEINFENIVFQNVRAYRKTTLYVFWSLIFLIYLDAKEEWSQNLHSSTIYTKPLDSSRHWMASFRVENQKCMVHGACYCDWIRTQKMMFSYRSRAHSDSRTNTLRGQSDVSRGKPE